MNDIMVSVICNAYNHGKYIRDALEGFVMQKTSFAYEVLVHDDASTDDTATIIKEYEEKYPNIIKPIYQTENQYSQGISIGQKYQFPRAQGKYIALCEGDDYWIDPLKLQKQYEIMEKYENIDMCAHGVYQENCETKEIVGTIAPSKRNRILYAEEVILGEGAFLGTNSLFYRSRLIKDMPKFRQSFLYDYALQIHGSLNAGIYYISDIMSTYRLLVPGSWTNRVYMNDEKRNAFQEKKLGMFKLLDQYTNQKYHDVIEDRIKMYEFEELEKNQHFKELTSKKFKTVRKRLSLKRRLAVFIKSNFVFIWKIKNRLKYKN